MANWTLSMKNLIRCFSIEKRMRRSILDVYSGVQSFYPKRFRYVYMIQHNMHFLCYSSVYHSILIKSTCCISFLLQNSFNAVEEYSLPLLLMIFMDFPVCVSTISTKFMNFVNTSPFVRSMYTNAYRGFSSINAQAHLDQPIYLKWSHDITVYCF